VLTLVDRGGLHQGSDCFGTSCNSQATDKVGSYNTMRTVSTIGFLAGAAVAATGVVLLLTAPRATAPSAALVIAPSSAAIRGTF
jgi:hypothetical protein